MMDWFLIYAGQGQEALARDGLMAEGFAAFLPEYSRAVARARHVTPAKRGLRSEMTIVERPLFPRYLFARFDPEAGDLSIVDRVRGVEGVVRGAGRPAVIADSVVCDIAGACAMGRFDELPPPRFGRGPAYQQGQAVKVIGGPLAEFVGKIKAVPHGARVLVVLEAAGLGRIAANLPLDSLARA